MSHSIWTHDALVASCVAVVGTILTTLVNNIVASINAARTARVARMEAQEDDARDDRRFAAEHDAALQDMALKTWASVYDALQNETNRLKARVAELEGEIKSLKEARRQADTQKAPSTP